ncbi:MAG: electron transfer flavoprotein subunit beta [Legionellales bacterium RIFCSPHIGHO2_12_FULL_35_11]|nr:MAG: electron transfer flavoprotein subunit beta [Legionellales bacterium RIFCSPHIGHO2_12_FULL_35_11]
MKILVAVKRVVDPYVRVRVKSDGTGVETQNIKMSMNPFDEIALEEAIRLKEKGDCHEVVIVSIADNAIQETLRHGLALGADRAILIQAQKTYCSLDIAKILQKVVEKETADIVLMGKQAIDSDSNQTPQMLAGILDWPQATFASEIKITDKSVRVKREVDAGTEELEVNLPAVLSVDLRLNKPRYPSLPNIMRSKQKPLEVIELGSLGLDLKNRTEILEILNPKDRAPGVKVGSVAELVDKLQLDSKVFTGLSH